jgi:hypothetical protein
VFHSDADESELELVELVADDSDPDDSDSD